MFGFFVICDYHQYLEYRVRRWRIEDDEGIPLVVTDGWYASDGASYFSIQLPGGESISSGDALGLATKTTMWRDFLANHGQAEIQKRLYVGEIFTCFTITLLPTGDGGDGVRNRNGWPQVDIGCPCGRKAD